MWSLKSINWWDALAVITAAMLAWLVVVYAVQTNQVALEITEPMRVTVRLPNPLPAVIEHINPGDQVLNRQGKPVARIIKKTPVQADQSAHASGSIFTQQDWLITLAVHGPLRLKRDHPGFPLEPGPLKVGVWCLLTTEQVDCSAMIIAVNPLDTLQD